jgi:hypothetical protein
MFANRKEAGERCSTCSVFLDNDHDVLYNGIVVVILLKDDPEREATFLVMRL